MLASKKRAKLLSNSPVHSSNLQGIEGMCNHLFRELGGIDGDNILTHVAACSGVLPGPGEAVGGHRAGGRLGERNRVCGRIVDLGRERARASGEKKSVNTAQHELFFLRYLASLKNDPGRFGLFQAYLTYPQGSGHVRQGGEVCYHRRRDDLGVCQRVDDGADLHPVGGATAVVGLRGRQLQEGVLVPVAGDLSGEPGIGRTMK